MTPMALTTKSSLSTPPKAPFRGAGASQPYKDPGKTPAPGPGQHTPSDMAIKQMAEQEAAKSAAGKSYPDPDWQPGAKAMGAAPAQAQGQQQQGGQGQQQQQSQQAGAPKAQEAGPKQEVAQNPEMAALEKVLLPNTKVEEPWAPVSMSQDPATIGGLLPGPQRLPPTESYVEPQRLPQDASDSWGAQQEANAAAQDAAMASALAKKSNDNLGDAGNAAFEAAFNGFANPNVPVNENADTTDELDRPPGSHWVDYDSNTGMPGHWAPDTEPDSMNTKFEDYLSQLLGESGDDYGWTDEELGNQQDKIKQQAGMANAELSQQLAGRGLGASGIAGTGFGNIDIAAQQQMADLALQDNALGTEEYLNKLKTVGGLYGTETSEGNRMDIAEMQNETQGDQWKMEFEQAKADQNEADMWAAAENMMTSIGADKADPATLAWVFDQLNSGASVSDIFAGINNTGDTAMLNQGVGLDSDGGNGDGASENNSGNIPGPISGVDWKNDAPPGLEDVWNLPGQTDPIKAFEWWVYKNDFDMSGSPPGWADTGEKTWSGASDVFKKKTWSKWFEKNIFPQMEG